MVWAAEVGRLLWLAPVAARRRGPMVATGARTARDPRPGGAQPQRPTRSSCSRCNRADQLDRPAREISFRPGTLSA